VNIGGKVNAKGRKNIFADKATLLLRAMIKEPGKKWVVRDFVNSLPISLGMASEVIATLETLGYVERIKKGPYSYTTLINIEKLINDWTQSYNFNLNTMEVFYNPNLKLHKVKEFFKQRDIENQYAFTLHTGANFDTSYVNTENIYLYISHEVYDKIFLSIRQQLDLKQLVYGGNIFLVKPYYKHSVFWGVQKKRGFNVVSNLQLYLDLYHFKPRGFEHADFLNHQLQQEGRKLG